MGTPGGEDGSTAASEGKAEQAEPGLIIGWREPEVRWTRQGYQAKKSESYQDLGVPGIPLDQPQRDSVLADLNMPLKDYSNICDLQRPDGTTGIEVVSKVHASAIELGQGSQKFIVTQH